VQGPLDSHVPSRLRPCAVAVLLAAFSCGAVAQYGLAAGPRLATPDRAALATAVPPHVSPTVRPQALRATTKRWSGVEVRARAATVTVRLSPTYADTEELARRWGEYLLGLIHGAEIDGLTLYLGTPYEVAVICGIDASGCYGAGSSSSEIVSVGDDSTGVRPEAIVAHEYGHFIAANRDNAPWRALDWGTKRWASAVGVCAGVRGKRMFPADQAWRYELNPGEGFAEAYRVLNQQSVAGGAMDWPIVHRMFFPHAAALEAIRQDVLAPWTRPTDVRMSGRLDRGGKARVTVATPLDGWLQLRAQGATAPARRLVCGTRKTSVSLTGRPGARFTLVATRP
jgi:hypothetical protein